MPGGKVGSKGNSARGRGSPACVAVPWCSYGNAMQTEGKWSATAAMQRSHIVNLVPLQPKVLKGFYYTFY